MGSKSNTKNSVGLQTQRGAGAAFAGNGPAISPTVSITDDRDQRFVIRLTNLDVFALDTLSKGQDVFINLATNPIRVQTLEGRRIGDVSATDTSRVQAHGSSGGAVIDFSADDPAFVAVRVG